MALHVHAAATLQDQQPLLVDWNSMYHVLPYVHGGLI